MGRPGMSRMRTGGETGPIIGPDGKKTTKAAMTIVSPIEGVSKTEEAPAVMAGEAVVIWKMVVVPKRLTGMEVGVPRMTGGTKVSCISRIPGMGTEEMIGEMIPPATA